MVKVTCDRCGRQIGTTFPWMNPEYPILTITSQVRTEEKPRMIDLCQVCKVKFYDWLDNGKSEQEFTDQESQSNPDGGNKRMTYGGIYRKATKVIPRDSISDYRPVVGYSEGFQLTNSDYINSIVIWLENGDEIIYTAKEPHNSNAEKEN